MTRSRFRALVTILALTLSAAIAPRCEAAELLVRFKIFLSEPGIYQVAYEDLAQDLGDARPPVETLGLRNAGAPVAIWIVGGDDGSLDPGDWIEFIGRPLPGENAYFNEFTNLNVYVLDFADPAPLRMHSVPQRPIASEERVTGAWSGWQHLEEDRLLMRFIPEPGEHPELWYWHKLSHLDAELFRHPIQLDALDLESGQPVSLRLHLQGLSHPRYRRGERMSDHRVEVFVNGLLVGAGEWDGADDYLLEVPDVPATSLRAGENELALRVPRRVPGDAPGGDPLVDVVLLNYVELEHPRFALIDDRPARLVWRAGNANGPVRITSVRDEELVIYTESGGRLTTLEMPVRRTGQGGSAVYLFSAPTEETEQWMIALPFGGLRVPDSLEVDRPSHLADRSNQADYLMLVHPRLRAAIEPLVELHRRRGLTVEVVDIRDVYDEFNHGIEHPRAIRDLIAHAYYNWARPAPRFVLLVGDASWDTKNKTVETSNYAAWSWAPAHGVRIPRNFGTPYSENADRNERNLIPTWSISSLQGHAASDSWFAAVDGDDIYPDLAIGRFPVVEPEEVTAIADKTIRYVESPEVGPWKRNLLWITNEYRSFQSQTDQVADQMGKQGFHGIKVYPKPGEEANEEHQNRLVDLLAEGQLLVHFWGHGGRFIWRTGRPDYKDQQDLFTLDDLDRLPASGRLPVVLSMTCYSGPFDHPNADSIGEKFLRVADRGAVAVLAASWRNGPTREFSQALVEELVSSESIGEAIVRAKRSIDTPDLVETYNLLGDPAVPLAVPRLEVRMTVSSSTEAEIRVAAAIARPRFQGRAIVEWTSADGSVLETDELELLGPTFEVTRRRTVGDTPDTHSVRAYVWSAEERVDGIGSLELLTASGNSSPTSAN